MARNAGGDITIRVLGSAAMTLALRTPRSISAVSPKKSPGPSWATTSSPRRTSAEPSSIAKNSQGFDPSCKRFLPSGTSTSSA
jgi:hypothetical protein